MLQGLLKMWMLKIISEKEVSGYEIIKKVDLLTGKKPSTGSVYPLLKSMQNEGWVVGEKRSFKTVYQVTDSGKKVLEAHGTMKEDYAQRISRSFYLAQDAFTDLHLVLSHDKDLINPLVIEVSKLLANGINPQKIKCILGNAMTELVQLEGEHTWQNQS